MINTTKDIMIIKEGEALTKAIINAIDKAKNAVVQKIFHGQHIDPESITNGSTNRFFNASIVRFYNHHDSDLAKELYNKDWINRLFSCSKKMPDANLARSVLPPFELNRAWINKTSCERLKKDANLIIHFLWSEGAVLIPLNQKLPTSINPDTQGTSFEFAADYYPEVLAVVRKPFCTNMLQELPDISECPSMAESAIINFNHYAWRLVRACTWYKIEDIDEQDVRRYWDSLIGGPSANFHRYPISPVLIFSCIRDLYPDRVTYGELKRELTSSKKSLTAENLKKGIVHLDDEIRRHVDVWLNFEARYIKHLESKGSGQTKSAKSALNRFKKYLVEAIGEKFGAERIPHPCSLKRSHIEGFDGNPSLLELLSEGLNPSGYQAYLYQINKFFTYLATFSNTGDVLEGFSNPISSVDFPVVASSKSTNKVEFKSEHFGPFIEFLYALEAFAFYLAERIYYHEENSHFQDTYHIKKHKVYSTEKLGFIPIVYVDNPDYNESLPVTAQNRRSVIVPVKFIHKKLIPMRPRRLKSYNKLKMFPELVPLQHTIVALETGIRTIHIRYLDKREYDKRIDRSYPIPPVCDLYVSTDKVHGAWDSKVADTVMRLLDRQVMTHDWFDEPGMLDPVWYNNVKNSDFGKIITVFPRGMAHNHSRNGPFTHEQLSRYFKIQVFSFDLFCRYSLGIEPSNRMPEYFSSVHTLSSAEDLEDAFGMFEEARNLIEHTPHSCRASVVSEWIKILPPEAIGKHKTGHSSVAHVLYYAKVSRNYFKDRENYQRLAIQSGINWDETEFSTVKAEEVNSKLQKAMKANRLGALSDFGGTSFERETSKGEILSGVKEIKRRPLDQLTFQGTHICPFGMRCPDEVIKDLNAIPGKRMPCGGCYYSVKTVDNLPRITGHIRSLIEENSAIKEYIDEALANGANPDSLVEKSAHRKYLADEISAWSVTAFCLQKMHDDLKTRNFYLVEKPEIISERLEGLVLEEDSLESLLARMSEAKTHAEFFTPSLKAQMKKARKRILAKSGAIHRLLEDEPSGFTMLDECRGLIRNTCDVLGISVKELSAEIDKPLNMGDNRPEKALKLIFSSKGGSDA